MAGSGGVRVNRRGFLRTVAAGSAVAALPAAPPALAAASGPAHATTPTRALRVEVDEDGGWRLTAGEDWTFAGSVGAAATHITSSTGIDAIGPYQQTQFDYDSGGARRSSIRVYQAASMVLFSTTYLESAGNAAPFPTFTSYPTLPYQLSHHDCFGAYQFNTTENASDSPWLFFDDSGEGFLLSAANHFPQAATTQATDGSIAAGIVSSVDSLPAGFTRGTLLAIGGGVGVLHQRWGRALTALTGKRRPANDSGTILERIGYWTDHGATYYYQYDQSLGYAGTLQAVINDWSAKGLPLAYLQLDSWWYPKGPQATWNNSDGEYLYEADPQLFPQGLAAFQRSIGLPLVTHARWIDPSSPYHQQYAMSGEVVTDPRFWQHVMSYLAEGGVTVYEQDWLCDKAQTEYNLTDPDAFFGNMARSASANGLSMQYCMPLPRDYLQGTLYDNLTTMRVSDDRFEPGKWDTFLYDSQLAAAVGAWPWCDVFMSGETANLLLCNLSAGPVGVGDPIGAEDGGNIMRVVRSDGVIVKPDTPIVPTDATYLADAMGGQSPMVAATHTDHGPLRYAYVFSYARTSGGQQAKVTPAALGVSGPVVVYDYFAATATPLAADATYQATVTSDGSYWIIAPVGPSGIGFLGDAGKFVGLGTKRVTSVSDEGSLRVGLAFAPGESPVTLHGYAPDQPRVTALEGEAGAVRYDPSTHLFEVGVSAGPGHTAQVVITR